MNTWTGGIPPVCDEEATILLRLKAIIALGAVLTAGLGVLTACTSNVTAVAGAGSDTTFWIMSGSDVTQGTAPTKPTKGISDLYNTAQTAAKAYDIPPLLSAPFPGPSYTVAADDKCGATTYNGTTPPPNGSSAGITALVNDTSGCIDYARSSRGAKATDPANLSFWAYALDALTWVKFPENTHGVTSLTPTQLKNIYTCDPSTGAPFSSDWSQIGGTAGPIVKYAPQTSSGTYGFINSKLLGGATIDQNCDATHKSTFIEEHDARGVATGDKPNAIYFFSVGQWGAQKGGLLVDLRNGSTLQKINGVAPSSTTINTTATRFFGTRYIYNVTKDTSPSNDAALAFVGVTASNPGYVCIGNGASTISAFGGFPLPTGSTGAGLPNSKCRLNPTPL
jgi:phosphate transport system substrate-binding protein